MVTSNQLKTAVRFCSVSLTDIVSRGGRLDASVYDIEAKHAREIIENGKYTATTLGGDCGLTNSFYPGRFKRIWVKRSNFPIFQPSSITDLNPVPIGYISHRTITDIGALRVCKGQLLITRSGTIGRLTLVSETLNNTIFSDDLLRISCYDPSDTGFVYVYLKSEIGNKILLTNSYGAVITHIEPEHLATVPIPNPPKKIKNRINELILKSYALRDESNNLIKRATQLLLTELHLPEFWDFNAICYNNISVKTYSVKLHDSNERLDASYHVPVVGAIVKHMKKYAAEVTTVGNNYISSDITLPGRFKRVYVEKEYGIKFLGGKEMHQLDPSTEKYLSRKVHKKQLEGTLGIKENSVLTPARGSLGEVAMPPKHFINWAISDNMMQIISYRGICGYLYVFLNTDYGKALIQRFTYGGVVNAIEPDHIKNVEIPLLKNHDIQIEINSLALTANEKRYQAYLLEQQALQILNEEVIYAA